MTKRLFPLTLALLAAPAFAQDAAEALRVDAADGDPLLVLDTDSGLLVTGAKDVGTVPTTGVGTRMMWAPSRAAFRAGDLNSFGGAYWDLANLGYSSAAFGENTRASGAQAFAAGLTTTASGAQAVAFGSNSTASGDRAVAMMSGTASALDAFAIGAGSQATADYAMAFGASSIAGGLASLTMGPSRADGSFSVAIGLQNLASAPFAFALGKNARATHQGSFVISDASAVLSQDSVMSARNNDFTLRATGGVRIFTSLSTSADDVADHGPIAGVRLAPGGGSWTSISDRNRKENVEPVDGEALLGRLRGVPVTTWNYIAEGPDARHMGPMAQDFHRAFGLNGADSLGINTVDIDGVALAAAQALGARTTVLAEENAALRAELDALRAEVRQHHPLERAAGLLGGLGLFAAGLGLALVARRRA